MEKDLSNSTVDYANFAEKTIEKLKQEYHAHSTGLQPVSNRKFGVRDLFRNRQEPDRAESEESGAPISPMGSNFVF